MINTALIFMFNDDNIAEYRSRLINIFITAVNIYDWQAMLIDLKRPSSQNIHISYGNLN